MNRNPEVSIDVDGTVISITTEEHMELNEENLNQVIQEIIDKKDKIEQSLGENWYPCGFAHLNISGNSDFVRWMKKHGTETRDGTYEFNRVRISKNSVSGGYSIHLDYDGHGPMQAQSLNFKRPLYNLFQDSLGLMEVRTSLECRLD